MDRLRVAVATNDGKSFVDRHFGDADFYDVYEVSRDGWTHVHRLTNRVEEETGHADPQKAKGIAKMLHGQSVQVALTQAFGPNLERIKSKFVCILTGQPNVAAGLIQIQRKLALVAEEWEKGETRSWLDFRGP